MMNQILQALLGAALLSLLAACGGGADDRRSGPLADVSRTEVSRTDASAAEGAARQLRLRIQSALAERAAPASPRRAEALGTEQAVDQLLDFAEAQFPEFFPSHPATQTAEPFRYRHYPQTGVYLGVVVTAGQGYEMEGVYALGGAFGTRPVYIGALSALIDFDADGVANSEDAAPLDRLCALAQDAQGGECLLRALAGTRLRLVGSGAGKLFFSAEGDALMLHAYDLKTRHFTARATMSGFTPTAFAYSAEHGRLYVGDIDGTIRAYSEALVPAATPFARIGARVAGLTAVGPHLLAQRSSGGWWAHVLFNRQGVQTHEQQGYIQSGQVEWSAATNRLYHFRDGSSPNDLLFEEIDPATGRVSATGETPYHGDYQIRGPIRVNPSGSKVLLGSGDLYAAPALTWAGKIPDSTMVDALWLANDELLVASTSSSTGGTRLRRYGADRVVVEELQTAGELVAMVRDGEGQVLITKTATLLDIRAYVATDDSDGDGVPNVDDRFPMDKTAAVDSDGDGHPDAFLAGYGPADSSTGLTLDAYPLDASCHAPAQGNGLQCDPSFYAPTFVPERVLSDGQGMFFLFKRGQDKVYRWSGTSGQYASPLRVGQTTGAGLVLRPISAAWSAEHRRLYLGYESGQISQVDMTATTWVEKPFAMTAMGVAGLSSAGQYLLAQDSSGAWATHYVFSRAGVLTESRDWNYHSSAYDWAPNQSRLYFFRSDTSPNDLHYEEINQDTGRIKSAGESPYHGDYSIQGPIRVSQGGGRIALGSGDIYSTTDLTVVASLKASWVDMQWLADGRLVALSSHAANSRLSTYNNSLALVRDQEVNGRPVAVVVTGSGVTVFTELDGRLLTTRLTP